MHASWSEAKAAGAKTYFTGKPCKHGHVAFRYVAGSICSECASEFSRSEHGKAKSRAWRQSPAGRASDAKFKALDRECPRAIARNRHTAQQQRMHPNQFKPSWQTPKDLELILGTYEEAARLTLQTGVLHVVDHIIPVNGENVTGLHVPSNLQILTYEENIKKRNHYETV